MEFSECLQGGLHLRADDPYFWWYQQILGSLMLFAEVGLGKRGRLLRCDGSDLISFLRPATSLFSLSSSSPKFAD